jgi:hypothetical protein
MSLNPRNALVMAKEATFLFCEGDPLEAARVFAKAVRHQPRGGKTALIRILVESLAKDDPAMLDAIAAEIARLARTSPNGSALHLVTPA